MSDDVVLPDEWKLVTTGDVAELVGGGTPKTTIPGNFAEDGGHPWITPADLTGYTDKYISRGKRNLTDQGLATSSAKYMPAGTVLYSTRAPIGYVAIAANPLTTNQGFRSFVPSPEVDPEYLYYGLKLARQEAERLASGTTFAELSGTNAKKLHLPLAPLDVQRRIVRLLDTAYASNASARRHLASARRAVERFREAVLAAACAGRLTADWRDASPESPAEPGPPLSAQATKNASGAPNTSALSDVPDTWGWWAVEAITSDVIDYRGRTPPHVAEGSIPHVRTTQIRHGTVDWNTDRFVTQDIYDKYMTRGLPRRGDVLFTMEAPMGEVGVIDRDGPFSIAQRILLLRPSEGVDGRFLALAMQSGPVRQAIELRSTGSGVVGIAYKRLRSVEIPRPPFTEQLAIVERVEQLLDLADGIAARIDAANARVDRSSQAVLAKAFRGELIANGTDARRGSRAPCW